MNDGLGIFFFLGSGDLEEYAAWREPTLDGNAIDYLLFTSGSTGAPKGVMVAHWNVTSFVDYIAVKNYKTFCPYLVGDYETVSNELALYVVAGYETFIPDIPASQEQLPHTSEVFKLATKKASTRKSPSAHLTAQAV